MRINQLSTMNIHMDKGIHGTSAAVSRTGTASGESEANVRQAAPMNPSQPQRQEGEYQLFPFQASLPGDSVETFPEEMVENAVEQANKNLEKHNRVIERAIHEVTHAVMYTVRDTVTNEIIAEFPPKRIQDMIAKMWEFAGLFVDEKI